MAVVRGLRGGLVGVALVIAMVACQPTPPNGEPAGSGSQPLATLSATPPSPQSGDVVWGRVPYCNCLVDAATDNVAGALDEANLTASLQELSPSEGWLYFVVTFDPDSATVDQIGSAMLAGGAEVLDGPP